MLSTLTTLISRLENKDLAGADVIGWGSPVPSFGDVSNSQIATVGINPSNREFLDEYGNELEGHMRRFQSLRSLGINSWSDVEAKHLSLILESCRNYFLENPYDRWFRRLETIVGGAEASYYGLSSSACHLDLVPFATLQKWTALTNQQRRLLLKITGDTLGQLLRDSTIRVLVLNGQSVVDQFQTAYCVELEQKQMPSWCLPRRTGSNVAGVCYKGMIDGLSGVTFGHGVLVLGYNHNIQSSFGVTEKVMRSIRDWIGRSAGAWL